MAVNNARREVSYGLSDALLNVFPAPIVSTRDPATSDKAQIGTVWVNKSSSAYFVLTSIAANVATWATANTGTGVFTSVEATTGDVTSDLGDVVVTAGDVIVSAGDIAVTLGSVLTGAAVSAATTVTAGTGLVATTGGVTSTGDTLFSAGTFGVTSGTNTISLSTDATATTVNLATGAGAKTVTLGSTNSTSTTTIHSGSGGVLVTNGTNPITISDDAAATTLKFGTGAAAKTVTIGSTTTTSTTTINAGSGNINLVGATAVTGALTASTTLTATLGAITASNGDFVASTAAKGVVLGGGAKVVCGTGDPNASVTAPQGSLYLRLDGSSSSTRAYINSDAGTTWVAVTTAT